MLAHFEISDLSVNWMMKMNYDYDFAVSFAGEDRQKVSEVVDFLQMFNIHVFYDELERHKLIGEDLYSYFAEIYEKKARYCVMFISKNYVNKAWPKHERKFAQARAFSEDTPYILPVKLDSTECPGIPKTVGYIDGANTSSSIALLLIQKLGVDFLKGGCNEFLLSKNASCEITLEGNLNVSIDYSFVYLGKKECRSVYIYEWSSCNRPLNVKKLKALDSKGELKTKVINRSETDEHWNIFF